MVGRNNDVLKSHEGAPVTRLFIILTSSLLTKCESHAESELASAGERRDRRPPGLDPYVEEVFDRGESF